MKYLLNLFRITFRAQLIYGIGLFLTLLISLFIYIETTTNNSFTRQKALSEASDHSIALSTMVKVWVLSNDYVGLEDALDYFSIYDNLMFATVINMDGKIIAHTDRSLVGKYIADKYRIKFLREAIANNKSNVQVLRNKHYIDVIRMIPNKDKQIGMVNIRIDQTAIEKRIQQRTYEGIAFGLFYMFVTVLFLYIIVNTFTKQLSSLLTTMKKIHDGEKDVKADEEGNNELSQLSHEFNHMLEGIVHGELALKMAKERLEYAVNGSNDGVWDWDIQTGEVYYSLRWKEMLGFADNEFPNEFTAWEEHVYLEDLESVKNEITLSHFTKDRQFTAIYRMYHKDGSLVWILARGKTIFDNEGKAIRMVGFNTDITKQKELEQELVQRDEMLLAQSRHVAMGEMIGMIAHQWRQPITIIAMGANNMLLDIMLGEIDNHHFEKEIKQILDQTQHLSKTIDDFRNFFRPNKDKDEVKIVDILHEANGIVAKSLEYHNINFTIHSDEISTTNTYSRELLQVFLNIIKNSQEAIDQSKHESGCIDANVKSSDESILITITDNGGGVDEDILNRIFEPYFSTKDKKSGTGLGLYMSKTIITKHLNGSITAENTTNGLRFSIIIPKEFNKKKDNE